MTAFPNKKFGTRGFTSNDVMHARWDLEAELKSVRRNKTLVANRSAVRKDDRFLRGYHDRISPDAESGYRHLKSGRNSQRAQAVGGATMAGLTGWLLSHEAKQRPVSKPGVVVTAASTMASAGAALSQARGAHRYNQKMDKIKASGRSRRAQGLYGPGRGLSPVDTSSARSKKYAATNLAKAMGAAR